MNLALLPARRLRAASGGARRFHGTPLTYGELLETRAARSPAASRARRRRATASPSCSTTASRRRSSTGRRSGLGAVFVPLSWRLSEAGGRVLPRRLRRDGRSSATATSCRDGAGAPAARSTLRRARDVAAALHLRHDGPAQGRAALASRRPRRRAGRRSLQHGYGFGDRTLGVMPLYHTMGIHSLLAMHLSAAASCRRRAGTPGEALALIEAERVTSLYLAPTLFHDLVHHADLERRDLSSVARARLRGRRR